MQYLQILFRGETLVVCRYCGEFHIKIALHQLVELNFGDCICLA